MHNPAGPVPPSGVLGGGARSRKARANVVHAGGANPSAPRLPSSWSFRCARGAADRHQRRLKRSDVIVRRSTLTLHSAPLRCLNYRQPCRTAAPARVHAWRRRCSRLGRRRTRRLGWRGLRWPGRRRLSRLLCLRRCRATRAPGRRGRSAGRACSGMVVQHDSHAVNADFQCAMAFRQAQHDAQIAPGDTAAPAARLARHRLGGRRWSVGSHLIRRRAAFYLGNRAPYDLKPAPARRAAHPASDTGPFPRGTFNRPGD
eukprot:scaffold13855_cov131-Isochrysis_galbana.AAC.2